MTEEDPISEPVACSLTPEQLPARRAALAALVEGGLLDATVHGAVGRLRLRPDDATAARLDAFLRAERECCPFLDFRTRRTPEAIEVEVRAPAGAEAMVAALVGAFRVPSEVTLERLRAGSG